ncbi:MAG: hypothetical protein V7K48_11445 [Nostoc sp.]|uniref:hypothetical protein n=1 Tax=Nostoc sp. TaxID=1180 RepID=UPI002FF5B401
MKHISTGVPPLYVNGMGVHNLNSTLLSRAKSNQSNKQFINTYIVINCLSSYKNFSQKAFSKADTGNKNIHNSSVMNAGGTA